MEISCAAGHPASTFGGAHHCHADPSFNQLVSVAKLDESPMRSGPHRGLRE